MEPLLEISSPAATRLLEDAEKKPEHFTLLFKALSRYPDVCFVPGGTDLDIDVIISIILRFLKENIFDEPVFGKWTREISYIEMCVEELRFHAEPKRGMNSPEHVI